MPTITKCYNTERKIVLYTLLVSENNKAAILALSCSLLRPFDNSLFHENKRVGGLIYREESSQINWNRQRRCRLWLYTNFETTKFKELLIIFRLRSCPMLKTK